MSQTLPPEPAEPVCYRHVGRPAGVRCQRCDRYVCVECALVAAVGFQCPECVRAGRPVAPPGEFGGRRTRPTPRRRYERAEVIDGPVARPRAFLTGALVGANLVLYVLSAVAGRSLWSGAGGLGGILYHAALWGPRVDAGGEWWRLLSSGFVHANIVHVGFNVLLLGLLGAPLERTLGVGRFALLYVASLLSGSLGALVASPQALTVGASGAVFGLMGAHLMSSRASGRRARDSGVMGLLLLNLLSTFLIPNISIGGHIGGLAGGLVASWLLLTPNRNSRIPTWAAWMLVVALIALFFFTGLLAAATWADPIF